MPTYDYKCLSCGKTQEEIHSYKLITNDENDIEKNIVCKNCGEKKMKRCIGGSEYAVYHSSTPEEKRQMLKKRSHKHFEKEIKEKFITLTKK